MTPLQSLIKEREEAFDEKFLSRGFARNDNPLIEAQSAKSFNHTTIRKTLEAVRSMCEGMEKPTTAEQVHEGVFRENVGYNSALGHIHFNLTEELDKMI